MVEIVNLISTYSILIPALAGIILFRNLLAATKVISALVWGTTLLDFTVLSLSNYGINNMFLFHAHTFLEFGLLSYVYFGLSGIKFWRKTIVLLQIIFLTFSVFSLIYFENIFQFNTIQRNVEHVLLGIILGDYLLKSLKASKRVSIRFSDPFLVLTFGLILYFAGTFCLFFFAEEVFRSNLNFWIIHGVLNIFLNVIYTVVLIRGRYRTIS